MTHSNCLVAQSGGPTAAINSSLAGVISGVINSEKYDVCYGAINGILGILGENYLNLSNLFSAPGLLDKLKSTPAMYLGSCRYKLPNYNSPIYTFEALVELFYNQMLPSHPYQYYLHHKD